MLPSFWSFHVTRRSRGQEAWRAAASRKAFPGYKPGNEETPLHSGEGLAGSIYLFERKL
ncbi:MAG: hypothetical protein VKL59_02280 [Nostocaceae cyanobacterium]|nr:hypothetical protein [Nostocaceae cyanobacterium]